jgi:hypothetical protein
MSGWFRKPALTLPAGMGRGNPWEIDGGEHCQGRRGRGRQVGGPITLRRSTLAHGQFGQPAGETVSLRGSRDAERVGESVHRAEEAYQLAS